MFTQPLMYKTIEKQIPVVTQYEEQLIKQGIVTREECEVRMGQAVRQAVKSIGVHYDQTRI
jgi:2-oxoglutarate dehydrogenase complex dehydrogenase (E1) component-like enzyme